MKDSKSDRFVIREDAEIWRDLLVFNGFFFGGGGGLEGFCCLCFVGLHCAEE